MRLLPEQRHLLVNAIRRGVDKSTVARECETGLKPEHVMPNISAE